MDAIPLSPERTVTAQNVGGSILLAGGKHVLAFISPIEALYLSRELRALAVAAYGCQLEASPTRIAEEVIG